MSVPSVSLQSRRIYDLFFLLILFYLRPNHNSTYSSLDKVESYQLLPMCRKKPILLVQCLFSSVRTKAEEFVIFIINTFAPPLKLVSRVKYILRRERRFHDLGLRNKFCTNDDYNSIIIVLAFC